MRNDIFLALVSLFIRNILACRKSCTKELCYTATDIVTAGCYTGSISTELIPTEDSVIGKEIGIGCKLESIKVQFGGCALRQRCDGNSPENVHYRKNLTQALEGLRNILREVGDLEKDEKELKAQLIKQGIGFKKWFEELGKGRQDTLQKKLESLKNAEMLFRDQSNSYEEQKILRQEFEEMRALIVQEFFSNDTSFNILNYNDREILLEQRNVVSKIYGLEQRMMKVERTLDSLEGQIEEDFLNNVHNLDIRIIIDVIKKFPDLKRQKSGVLERDPSYNDFMYSITNDLRVWIAVKNIYEMMIGTNFPLQKSMYANKTFCRHDLHERLKFVAAEGMSYVLFANRHASSNINDNLSKHQEYRVKADEAYIEHCGCPSGYQKKSIKTLSDLIPSLTPSDEALELNIAELGLISENMQQHQKGKMMLEYKNFKPTRKRLLQIDSFSRNMLRLAIVLTEKNLPHLLQYYDGRTSCIEQPGR